ncbi:hypothetical protein RLOatenuis_3860 [Rickettsiales bacterium]|nr:hypothetical protein RLOatenuis_3860 [Rickettsiales bacterium]
MCFVVGMLALEILFGLAVGAAFGLGYYYVSQHYQQEVVFVEYGYPYNTPYYVEYQPVVYTTYDEYDHYSNYDV